MSAVIPDIFHIGIGAGQPSDIPFGIAEIEVLVTVPVVSPVDELIGTAFEEPYRVLRLDESVIVFSEESPDKFSRGRVVHVQPAVPLAAVEHLYEKVSVIR